MERSGYENFEAGVVRKNRGLTTGKGGGVRKQVFRVKRLLRISFFPIANACKLHL